jgi:hypothetical protein
MTYVTLGFTNDMKRDQEKESGVFLRFLESKNSRKMEVWKDRKVDVGLHGGDTYD